MERISGAVTAFMVEKTCLLDSYIERLVPEYVITSLYMLFHKLIFFIGKSARLVENLIGYCEFSNIMKKCCNSEYLKVVARDTEPLAKNIGYKSNIQAVGGCDIVIIAEIMYYVKDMNGIFDELISSAVSAYMEFVSIG